MGIELTWEQAAAIDHILSGENVFLTGGAGTGKSAVLKIAIRKLIEQGKSVIVCAPTGIAALQIGGITIHKAFGFSSGEMFNTHRKLALKSPAPSVICAADVVVIDEISMVRMDLFDAVVLSLQKAEKKKGRPIQLIVSGDFYQLPPVMAENSETVTLMRNFYGKNPGRAYAFQGLYWQSCHFTPAVLTITMRQDNPEFTRNLNLARTGNPECIDYFNSRCVCSNYSNSAEYDEILHLYAKKDDVRRMNTASLHALPGKEYIYHSDVELSPGVHSADIDISVMNALPKDLVLKNRARVIFTTNDNHGKGCDILIRSTMGRFHYSKDIPLFVNGSGGVVMIDDDITDGPARPVYVCNDRGDILSLYPCEYPIYRYVMNKKSGKTERCFSGVLKQLPILPAYAFTIHKSQGQTYEAAVIQPDVFCPGQLYVALSRVKTIEGLHLIRPLRKSDLFSDPAVDEFYASLTPKETRRRRGRPAINKDGSLRDVMIWVPLPLYDHIRQEAEANVMIPMTSVPAYGRGRKHLRVSSGIASCIKDEINEWKAKCKTQ